MTNRDSLVETAFPDLKKNSRHELEYSNTEYLYDIYGSSTYVTTSILLNPGLMESFPMLSGMATQFETYKFTKLEFYYKPFVASMLSSSNSQLGFIGFLHCVDANEDVQNPNGTAYSAFPSKASFLNYEGAISAKPSVPMKFVVDVNRYHKQNLLYVRQGDFINNDLRMTDTGSLVWACGDQQSTGLMGELYVKYTVKFLKSKPSYSLANSNKFSHYRLSGTISSTTPFGTVQTPVVGSNIRLSFGKTSIVNFFKLPPYPALVNYMFILQYAGDSGAWEFAIPSGTLIPLLANNTVEYSSATGNSATQTMVASFNTPNNIGASGTVNEDVQISFLNLEWSFLSNITSADLFVFQIPTYAYSIP